MLHYLTFSFFIGRKSSSKLNMSEPTNVDRPLYNHLLRLVHYTVNYRQRWESCFFLVLSLLKQKWESNRSWRQIKWEGWWRWNDSWEGQNNANWVEAWGENYAIRWIPSSLQQEGVTPKIHVVQEFHTQESKLISRLVLKMCLSLEKWAKWLWPRGAP